MADLSVRRQPLTVRNRPTRFRLTYAFELIAIDGAGAAGQRGANRVVNLPINPQRYEIREAAAAEITPTAGGVVAEERGFLTAEITIAGTCGLATRRGWASGSLDRPGGMIRADGNTLFRHLWNLFRIYGRLKRDEIDTRVVLAWHDFPNDRHWVVVPTAFRIPREADRHRLHYPYEIDFTAVAELDSVARGFFDDGVVRQLGDAVGTAVAAVQDAAGYLEDVRAFLDGARDAIVQPAQAAFDAAADFVAAAAGITRGVSAVMNIPRDLARAARDTWDEMRTTIELELEATGWTSTSRIGSRNAAALEATRGVVDAMDIAIANPDLWSPGWADLDAERRRRHRGESELSAPRRTADLTLASPALPGAESRRATTGGRDTDARRYTAQRTYSVRKGDTLTAIAARELGDSTLWSAIAEANRLRAPYVSPLGMPGTVRPGDTLVLPAAAGAPDAVSATGPRLDEDADRTLLGVDIAIGDDGRWTLDPASSHTELRMAVGVDNYVQGLERIRFRTTLGENLLYPHLGIVDAVGDPNGLGTADAIATSVRTAALQDPRTTQVTDVELVDDGDTVAVTLTVGIKGRRGGRVVRRALE